MCRQPLLTSCTVQLPAHTSASDAGVGPACSSSLPIRSSCELLVRGTARWAPADAQRDGTANAHEKSHRAPARHISEAPAGADRAAPAVRRSSAMPPAQSFPVTPSTAGRAAPRNSAAARPSRPTSARGWTAAPPPRNANPSGPLLPRVLELHHALRDLRAASTSKERARFRGPLLSCGQPLKGWLRSPRASQACLDRAPREAEVPRTWSLQHPRPALPRRCDAHQP